MSISEHKHVSDSGPVQRIEVFTGAGRRRSWTPEEKASIVAESFVEGATACQVARRHGLTPQQLFTWRRQARGSSAETAAAVCAGSDRGAAAEPARKRGRPRGRRRGDALGVIEVEIDGVTVRVGRGAEAKTVAAVIRALKAGA